MANSILRFKFFRRRAKEKTVADSHRARQKSMARQSGFTLVELGISTAIVLVGLVFGGGALVQKINESAADATGTYMLAIRTAMNAGINKHNIDFANGDLAKIRMDFPSLSNPVIRADGVKVYTIALSDFITSGFLQSGFPTATPLKQAIQIQAYQLPGCSPAACTIESMANTATPVRPNIAGGNTDSALVGRVLTSLNGFGGASQSANPGVIKGATFVQNNPIPNQDGIVAVYASSKTATQGNVNVGTDPSGNPCVHIDTAGRIDVNCQGLINTKDIAATGTVNAGTVTATGNISASGTVSGGAVRGGSVQSTAAGSAGWGDVAGNRIAAASSIYSYGTICSQNNAGDCSGPGGTVINGASINTGSIYTTGSVWANGDYPLRLTDASGGWNSQPQNSQGSAFLNDIYIRSVGKWASQLGGSIKNYADFGWTQGMGTYGTGLPYSSWSCALSQIGGKFAGGSEVVQVVRDGGSGTWLIVGSSGSDNSGAFGRVTCVQMY